MTLRSPNSLTETIVNSPEGVAMHFRDCTTNLGACVVLAKLSLTDTPISDINCPIRGCIVETEDLVQSELGKALENGCFAAIKPQPLNK